MRHKQIEDEADMMLAQMCGGPEPYLFLKSLFEFILAWDHAVDNDGIVPSRFNEAMRGILVTLMANDFVAKFRNILLPVLINAISAWEHSNGKGSKIKAYDIYTELSTTVAFLVGGPALVDKYIPGLRDKFEEMCKVDDEEDGGKK